ncbi:MAG: hypothetical protein ACRD1R_04025, partial [Acidobacteriota bacterium]
ERDQLFPDEMFADLFNSRGRRSVPPSIVATVMVLQRLEGCSDREAVDRFTYESSLEVRSGSSRLLPRLRAHRAGGYALTSSRLLGSRPDI